MSSSRVGEAFDLSHATRELWILAAAFLLPQFYEGSWGVVRSSQDSVMRWPCVVPFSRAPGTRRSRNPAALCRIWAAVKQTPPAVQGSRGAVAGASVHPTLASVHCIALQASSLHPVLPSFRSREDQAGSVPSVGPRLGSLHSLGSVSAPPFLPVQALGP